MNVSEVRVGSYNPDLGYIHTVTVDEARGLLYLSGMPVIVTDPDLRNARVNRAQGIAQAPFSFTTMRIYTLADPEHPRWIGSFPTSEYVHDIHVRGTLGYAALIYDGYLSILDLSDPANARELTRFTTPKYFAHSAWTTSDARTLYVADEEKGPNALHAWDIRDLSRIRRTWGLEGLEPNIPHNPRVRGDVLFVSHYTAGVRLFDISNPQWPVEFGHYDEFDDFEGGYHGDWEVTPYFPSGIFAISDMETGLWVFRAAPKNYGIVRGTVREGSSGPPIAGATIVANPGGLTVKSGSDGRFAMALDAPGSYTLTITCFRFEPDVKSNANVNVGSDRTITISLQRKPTGTLSGIVSAAGGGPLDAAELLLEGTGLQGITGASGAYQIDAVPVGAYTVRCMRPGYAAASRSVTVVSGANTANFALPSAVVYDDIEADRGWTLSIPQDDATAGTWIRAVPVLSYLRDFATGGIAQTLQPGADHSPGAGTMCFVTGNAFDPRFVFDACVTNGSTTLTSPAYTLGGISDPRIGYWRWYTNTLEPYGFPVLDPLVTQVSGDGGQTWIEVDRTLRDTNAWEYFEIRVRDWLPSASTVRVRVIASESDFEFTTVEALVDDVALYSGGITGSPASAISGPGGAAASVAVIGRVGPVPSQGTVRAAIRLPGSAAVRADVFDVQGRLVRILDLGLVPAGSREIVWDGRRQDGAPVASGVYWMRLRAGAEERQVRLVLAR
jgi:hypothetical protein